MGAPQGPSKQVVIPLFISSHKGYGDEVKTQEYRYHRVHGSLDARWPGQIKMGLRIRELVANNHDAAPIFATEWEDSSGNPIVYYVVDNEIRSLQNGANAQAGGGTLTTTATGAMFEDDGTVAGGEPFLYTCYGGSGSNYIQRMDRAAASFETSADVVADKLLTCNGYAYRTIVPASGTQPCQVSTISPGSDRNTAANWGAGVMVGHAGTPINNLAKLRESPVAVKPEGIFVYSNQLDRWINRTPGWERHAHPDNGLTVVSLGDAIIVGLVTGSLIILSLVMPIISNLPKP